MGRKEEESSTGCIWAAGFHHVMARSCLALILKLVNRLSSLWFPSCCVTLVNKYM
jgi:hypothetical protein